MSSAATIYMVEGHGNRSRLNCSAFVKHEISSVADKIVANKMKTFQELKEPEHPLKSKETKLPKLTIAIGGENARAIGGVNNSKSLKSVKSLRSLAIRQRSRQENSYIPQETVLNSRQAGNQNNRSRYMFSMVNNQGSFKGRPRTFNFLSTSVFDESPS